MAGVNVVARPVDGGRLAVALAPGGNLEAVLAHAAQPHELAHLFGEVGDVVLIGHVQPVALAGDAQVALVARQLGVWIAVKY